MGKMSEVLAKINSQMHEGRCPQSGCIGECAAMDETTPGVWWAALYIWDNDFNDSTRVAKWFHDAGAVDVLVSHVLYDSANDDRDGRCFDGVRAWHVQFSMPQNAKVRGPEAALSPEAPSRLPGSTPGTNEERAGNA